MKQIETIDELAISICQDFPLKKYIPFEREGLCTKNAGGICKYALHLGAEMYHCQKRSDLHPRKYN